MHSLVDMICRISNPIKMSPLFREIASHLDHFGYTTTFDNRIIKTEHTSKPNFWVHPSLSGALFIAVYNLGPGGKADPSAVEAFVNRVNSKNTVSRFVAAEDYISISAWYPAAYEMKAFAEFLNQYLTEVSSPPGVFTEEVKRLFWQNPNGCAVDGM